MTQESFLRTNNLTFAARFIGIFDLIASSMAINLLADEFYRKEEGLTVFRDVEIFLDSSGANDFAERNAREKIDNTWILICLMIHSTFYFLSSFGLISGTISRKRKHTLPWLILEIINLANQANDVFLRLYQFRCENYETSKITAGGFPLASFYLLIGVYFFTIVFTAQKSWPDNFPESNDEASHKIYMDSSRPKSTVTMKN